MLHRLVVSLLALFVLAIGAIAAETKGKVKFLNVKKGSLTITANDKDFEFTVPAGAKIVDAEGKDLPDRLKAFKAGDELIVTTEKDGDKDVVREVRRK